MTLRRMSWGVPVSLARACLIALAFFCLASCSGEDSDRVAIAASLADATADPLEFYATQSPTTDPGEYAHLLAGVPANAEGVVRAVQNVMVRMDEVDSGAYPNPDRQADRDYNIATVRGILARIAELDDRPLTETRERQNYMVGVCAQHAMLATALFRHHGIPSRARGGFEAYFSQTKHHDHWITEYWNEESGRWVRVDAEIDEGARNRWGVEIDGLDLAEGTFLTGAEAWRLCRVEGKPPGHFGIAGDQWYGGWDFVMNELQLDFNALNKVESLPWDEMALTEKGYDDLTTSELILLDDTAQTILKGDPAFPKLRSLYKSTPLLRK